MNSLELAFYLFQLQFQSYTNSNYKSIAQKKHRYYAVLFSISKKLLLNFSFTI